MAAAPRAAVLHCTCISCIRPAAGGQRCPPANAPTAACPPAHPGAPHLALGVGVPLLDQLVDHVELVLRHGIRRQRRYGEQQAIGTASASPAYGRRSRRLLPPLAAPARPLPQRAPTHVVQVLVLAQLLDEGVEVGVALPAGREGLVADRDGLLRDRGRGSRVACPIVALCRAVLGIGLLGGRLLVAALAACRPLRLALAISGLLLRLHLHRGCRLLLCGRLLRARHVTLLWGGRGGAAGCWMCQ